MGMETERRTLLVHLFRGRVRGEKKERLPGM